MFYTLMIVAAVAALLLVMTRQGVMWKNPNLWLGLVAAIAVAVLIGWYADYKTNFSVLIAWGWSGGIMMKTATFVLVTGTIVSIGGMLMSARKSGSLVS